MAHINQLSLVTQKMLDDYEYIGAIILDETDIVGRNLVKRLCDDNKDQLFVAYVIGPRQDEENMLGVLFREGNIIWVSAKAIFDVYVENYEVLNKHYRIHETFFYDVATTVVNLMNGNNKRSKSKITKNTAKLLVNDLSILENYEN